MTSQPDSHLPSTPRRRQFSLRWLMGLTLVCCVGLALWTIYVEPYRRQQRLADRIVELKGAFSTEPSDTFWNIVAGEKPFQDIVSFNSAEMEVEVDDAWMAHLRDTPKLRELVLPNESIGDAGLAHVAPLEHLRSLSISGTKISSAGLTSLQKLHRLEWLHVAHTQTSDVSLASLANLRRLKTLYLNGCPITDAGLAHLANLTDLESLYLHETRITDEGVAHLSNLKKLSTLQLNNTEITEASLPRLQQLPALRNVSVAGTHIIPSALREAFPALHERAVRKALAEPTVIQFIETPLQDVVDYLKDYHKIEIQLDHRKLLAARIGADTPITQRLSGPLGPALNTLLEPVGLKHVICYDGLMITNKADPDTWRPRLVVKPGIKVSRQLSGALFRGTPFEFVETPLADVLAYASDRGIKILFAKADELSKRRVTHNSRAGAGNTLELLFHELDLHGVIEGDTIFVYRGPAP